MNEEEEYLKEEIYEKMTKIGFRVNPERGEREDFLKITITIPHDMLCALKMFSINQKKQGKRDTDVSSIVRSSIAYYLLKWSEDYREKIIGDILN